jgi:hypothetical protein
MPLTKKQRNTRWYAYVIGMIVFYEASMIVFDFSVTAFLVAFVGIAVLTLGFVVYMRRATRPAVAGAATTTPTLPHQQAEPRGGD